MLSSWSVKDLEALLPPSSPQLAYYLCRTYGGQEGFHRHYSLVWRWQDVDVVWREHVPPGWSLSMDNVDPDLFSQSISLDSLMCPAIAAQGQLFHPCIKSLHITPASRPRCQSCYHETCGTCFFPKQTLWINHGPSRWDADWEMHTHTNQMGGSRNQPVIRKGEWMEVSHYGGVDNAWGATWFYAARGSGLWYYTGDTLVANDIVDIARYFNVSLQIPNSDFVDRLQRDNAVVDKSTLLQKVMEPVLSNSGINTVITLKHQDPGRPYRTKEIISFPGMENGRVRSMVPAADLKRCPKLPNRVMLHWGWGTEETRRECRWCAKQNAVDCRDPNETSHTRCSVYL
jgi:hypothetical protein